MRYVHKKFQEEYDDRVNTVVTGHSSDALLQLEHVSLRGCEKCGRNEEQVASCGVIASLDGLRSEGAMSA